MDIFKVALVFCVVFHYIVLYKTNYFRSHIHNANARVYIVVISLHGIYVSNLGYNTFQQAFSIIFCRARAYARAFVDRVNSILLYSN